MSDHLAVILAAGKGTRMKSELPKVLVPVLGRPMIHYVLDAVRAAGLSKMAVVVGYQSELVRRELAGQPGVEFVEQPRQLGTGHAVMMCRSQIASHNGGVLILAGDSPLTQASSLRRLTDTFDRTRPACLIGTAFKEDPTGLGRVVRNEEGDFIGIVEEKDATPEQRTIKEVNMSTYVFEAGDLLWALDRITTSNAQEEYYVTDCPGALRRADKVVQAEPALESCETMSINTLEELAEVESEMRRMGMSTG